jgi:Tol biopolymer transport system component
MSKEISEEIVNEYVLNNKYPSYDEITKLLLENKRLDLFSEYGEYNHELCKEIYENINDEKIVVKNGKLIYKRGGFTALQANFYIISSIFLKSDNIIINSQPRCLEYTFQKVTPQWQA